ncbi:MAG: ribosome biogenesis GTPase Der [Bacteroidetes bacterium RIFOXYA12_FULL_35_11]|nr:MAG: ribosome biogenesis GTPase Der [Bacteroidetes bacterium GWF2_35_48]OFY78107.1 MAG: ribosome biogenesis GTPase Der [Bacteroidetes bacterium RIFOXYA12_FULL_35_11]HBX53718.1 ribosome biogenesis GTPase Der [Bacteroidales bacterium]
MSNIVAIVGRPNVGKSTLFNRLTKTRTAIVNETAGVTRDRHYGFSDWNGIEFSVIDTGGYVINSADIFEQEIRRQVELAIQETDVIIFLVDVENGITDMDISVAGMLRKSNKKVLLAVNKVDNHERYQEISEFYSLGLGEFYSISSISGSGTGELLDAVVESFTKTKSEGALDLPKFSIIGRPNVGKSSLLNALIGEDRHIVTPIAGTTRDSIFTRYNKFNHDFYLVDTAGIRKKSKVSEDIEFYSVMRAIRSIENSDVCILLLDATMGFEAQDMNIFQLAASNNKGIVVVVNKWDLVEKETNSLKQYEEYIKKKLAPFNDVPFVFTSVINKQRIHKVLEVAIKVYENRSIHIPTSELNEYLLKVIEAYQPPSIKGKFVKIKFVTQLPMHYPCFAFYCNLPQYVKEPYKRFLENKIREKFDFTGVPIKIFMRGK